MIQWYPGHMAKATRQINEMAPVADLFIIVLDARAPLSSYNEDFDKIAPHKPRLFAITKIDLAEKSKVEKVIEKFNNDNDGVILVNLKNKNAKKNILSAANKLLSKKREIEKKRGLLKPRLRAIVIGVPNSGKSTLINTLVGKKKTKVGNTPGVTRGQQWVNAGDIQLLDTPGVLWPKFEDELIAIKLAVIGSIKSSVIPLDELFYDGYKLLSKYYPQKITNIGMSPATESSKIYKEIYNFCEKKSFTGKENKVDVNKGMTYFINYLKKIKGVTYD